MSRARLGSAALAAKNVNSTGLLGKIIHADHADRQGLVASLARPGGNVTGATFTPGPEICGKQAVDTQGDGTQLRFQRVDAKGPEEFDKALAAVAQERADALLVGGTSTYLAHRTRLAELAARGRLPTMYSFRERVETGWLMAYSVNMADFVGHAVV